MRSNPNDPPDILFERSGQTLGLELAELLPENRLERDSILQDTKRKIVARLQLDERTKDWAVTIMLTDDYAPKIRLGRCEDAISTALENFFTQVSSGARTGAEIPVPDELQSYIRRISIQPCDLHDDPRIASRPEPLIVFSAQHTNVVPDRHFPQVISREIEKKELNDLDIPTWLLLWSNHYAFGPFEKELAGQIDTYLTTHPSQYARVFYLHHHISGGITEFTSAK